MISIRQIQGNKLLSPYHAQTVSVKGVVTAVLRRGFFIQTADVEWDGERSDGIFVYSPKWSPQRGSVLQVEGECVDYIKHETAKPVTQIRLESADLLATDGPSINPIVLRQDFLDLDNISIAVLLNSLEGMLLSIPAGQTFIAPSNQHGDYVMALDHPEIDRSVLRSENNGVITHHSNPLRWFPGFRVSNYNHAPRVNVGAKLSSPVQGPLNYRADSYQLAVSDPFEIEQNYISPSQSSLKPTANSVCIMTLNCFNLDAQVESTERVVNPRQDVDDDWGEGRFHTLAQAVVLQANVPDIVALQEIQDNDGAEITETVDASKTYAALIDTIEQLSGIRYRWVDVPPKVGEDGGQPGGNIRNAYLYNPNRVSMDQNSVALIAEEDVCFEGSRKPLVCEFIEKDSGQRITVINVHLASKRHQASIFSAQGAGLDAKLSVREDQARAIGGYCQRLSDAGAHYYVTGDFNDTEFSSTLEVLLADHSINLVTRLPENQRFDYNHRGKLQVLMHGIVSERLLALGAEYEIIHGNELIGVSPGEESDKPSDHAYVLAKLQLA